MFELQLILDKFGLTLETKAAKQKRKKQKQKTKTKTKTKIALTSNKWEHSRTLCPHQNFHLDFQLF